MNMIETRKQRERAKPLQLTLRPATKELLDGLMKASGNTATQVFEDALDALVSDIEKSELPIEVLDMLCADCQLGTRFEYYMVQDAVWEAAKPPEEALLCIGCLEHRLGRELTRHDFDDSLLNQIPDRNRSRRLLDRMSRE